MTMFNIPKSKTKPVAIFIPSFGRAHQLSRVVDNIFENTPHDLFEIYFILEQSDQPSIDAVKPLRAKVIINKEEPSYAGAINTAYKETEEPFFFTGADDLGFYPDWIENALAAMDDKIMVIGSNDLGSIPIGVERDSTHYMVAREYINTQSGVVDRPKTVLYPYTHNWTDKEFIETAKMRGVYKYVPECIAEHHHWAWGKAQMDDTYRKGFQSSNEDQRLFEARKHLWQK